MKTVQLEVGVTVPVQVAQDALASRALELLKRELRRAATKAVEDFVANGITAELDKLSISAEKHTQSVK